MGWLFAVALGKPEGRVAIAIPSATGHVVSIGAVVIAVVMLGLVVDLLEMAAGIDQAKLKSARTMVS